MQRQIVLQTLRHLDTHPLMDEIFDEIHVDHPSISKSTVYRNLRQLSEDRIIRQLFMSDGLKRYDGRIDPHYHFQCNNCGRVFDVEMEYAADIDRSVRDSYAFDVEGHDIILWGVCLGCRDKKMCN